jgi:hypothetical protein
MCAYVNPHFFPKMAPGQIPVTPAKRVKPIGMYNTHEALSSPVCHMPMPITVAIVRYAILCAVIDIFPFIFFWDIIHQIAFLFPSFFSYFLPTHEDRPIPTQEE